MATTNTQTVNPKNRGAQFQPDDRHAGNHTKGSRSSSRQRRPPIERCYTIHEVAGFLAYSDKQLRRMCEQGIIRTVQARPRGHHRIPLSAIRDFLGKTHAYWMEQSDAQLNRMLGDALIGKYSQDEEPAQSR